METLLQDTCLRILSYKKKNTTGTSTIIFSLNSFSFELFPSENASTSKDPHRVINEDPLLEKLANSRIQGIGECFS